jgi:uncharacterized protein YdeI (BOF family)
LTPTIIIIIIMIMDTNIMEHQKRDQEGNSNAIGKVGNYKQPSAERERHTDRNKLKEHLQIMCHMLRLLQMSEREKLPKLKSKLIKLKEKINGVIEKVLEEEEIDITDINILTYAAATIMTQTMNEHSKRANLEKCKVPKNKNAETDKQLD